MGGLGDLSSVTINAEARSKLNIFGGLGFQKFEPPQPTDDEQTIGTLEAKEMELFDDSDSDWFENFFDIVETIEKQIENGLEIDVDYPLIDDLNRDKAKE